MKQRLWSRLVVAAFLCGSVPFLAASAARAAEVEMTFYGNQHFRLVFPGGLGNPIR